MTEFNSDFWTYFRSISPINSTPDLGTEAWDIREHVVISHMHWPKRTVAAMKKKMPAHVESEDLESLAYIGLLQAVDRYDHTLGVPFEAFISQRARSVIGDYIRDADWAPRSLRKKQRDITKAEEEIRQTEGREPTDSEVSNKLEIPLDEIYSTKYRADIAAHTYIEGNLEAQNKPSSLDSDEDELVVMLKQVASRALKTMAPKKATIVAMHYFGEKKLSEIAKLLRMSEVKVGALHAEAVLEIWQALQSVAHANE